ncbi:hypothetical protein [Ferrimonas balearica]|uniref:hypothetical protein n=1 Tax=Ferrimonas balearica TaxID=44012 RepID=UPI001C59BFF2|nr:hypothetical protein [Ferrimonas balearica]MBW3141506.1 hypothetical protein [Ferrimonas balearica]MBY6019736.1 hypothetical protein [Halomonas denitrificans]MBY6096802.1 hypothetical protein [Ferrimonas balearica]
MTTPRPRRQPRKQNNAPLITQVFSVVTLGLIVLFFADSLGQLMADGFVQRLFANISHV